MLVEIAEASGLDKPIECQPGHAGNSGNGSFRYLRFQQPDDLIFPSIELALSQGALRPAENFPLGLLRSQGFPGSHADKIPLKLCHEAKERHDDLAGHVVTVVDVEILFNGDEPDLLSDQLIDERDHFARRSAQAGKFGYDQGISRRKLLQDFLDSPLFPVLPGRNLNLDESING